MRLSKYVVAALTFITALILLIPGAASAEEQIRAYWVDTFNTVLNTPADVQAVVNNARAANANAIYAQVRRRGDAWYLNGREPLPEGVPIQAGFDPLAALIEAARPYGIEVHAYVIIGAVWNRHPVVLGPPSSPDHVFNKHAWDPVAKKIISGPENWLTRTLVPDNTPGTGITWNGHRFGNDFYLEPGHPDAEAYTVDVLMDIVRNYDIAGLHLDRIRYPDFSLSGQTPTTGANIGYNEVNVARFQKRFGFTGQPWPTPGDPLWMQWRRDQVTNLVRRIYLNTMAIKPWVKVSAATIAYGGGPVKEEDWKKAEAYWRVYQDWRGWTEEGILDIAAPMNYKREHTATHVPMFDTWNEWTKNHQYNRSAIIGLGAYINSVECTLRQVRRSLQPSSTGNYVKGIILYAMATTNVAVTANPCSVNAGANTPVRSISEFASALTTGKSLNGVTLYENPALNPVPVFAVPAAIPSMPWKMNPHLGYLKGFIKDADGTAVDAGDVTLTRVDDGTTPTTGKTSINTQTDGGGFYGGVDLAPGLYKVTVAPTGQAPHTMQCTAQVTGAQVADFDFTIDRNLPESTLVASQQTIWPPNNTTVNVELSGEAADVGLGLDSISVRVIDEYGTVEPQIAAIQGSGEHALGWSVSIPLEASRHGYDKDGRAYTIEVTLKDRACNTRTLTTTVVVEHDQRH